MADTRVGVREAQPVDGSDAELVRNALEVLDANWIGQRHAALARLYPHQWSWDSACIAIGYAPLRPGARAERELRSLFAGQWRDGLLPHIRFADDGGATSPAPSSGRPSARRTRRRPADLGDRPAARARDGGLAGLPPARADRERAEAFLRELMPRLVAWHEYLYRERTARRRRARRDLAPVGVGHGQLAALGRGARPDRPAAGGDPDYQRVDPEFVDAAAAADRTPSTTATPTSSSSTATCGYDPARIRDECPFVVQDVLFNSLLVQANRDLAEIARVLGDDPEPFEAWAELTADGPRREALGRRATACTSTTTCAPARTCRAQLRRVSRRSTAGVPTAERAGRMVEQPGGSAVAVDGRAGP